MSIQYGEIIALGRHKLMCGEATLREDVMRLVDGERVNLVLTDPPYSSGGLYAGDKRQLPSIKYQTTGINKKYPEYTHDNMDAHSWTMFNQIWHSNIFPQMEEGAYFMQFSDWRQLAITTDTIQTSGLTWRGVIVWNKTEACRPQKGLFRQQCEFIAYGTKGKIGSDFVLPGLYTHYQKPAEKYHVVGKPIELMCDLLKCVPAGAVVLDCFGGSGTTLIACEMTGRKCLMMEISPEYCEIIRGRYQELLPMEGANDRGEKVQGSGKSTDGI